MNPIRQQIDRFPSLRCWHTSPSSQPYHNTRTRAKGREGGGPTRERIIIYRYKIFIHRKLYGRGTITKPNRSHRICWIIPFLYSQTSPDEYHRVREYIYSETMKADRMIIGCTFGTPHRVRLPTKTRTPPSSIRWKQ